LLEGAGLCSFSLFLSAESAFLLCDPSDFTRNNAGIFAAVFDRLLFYPFFLLAAAYTRCIKQPLLAILCALLLKDCASVKVVTDSFRIGRRGRLFHAICLLPGIPPLLHAVPISGDPLLYPYFSLLLTYPWRSLLLADPLQKKVISLLLLPYGRFGGKALAFSFLFLHSLAIPPPPPPPLTLGSYERARSKSFPLPQASLVSFPEVVNCPS